MKFIINFLKYFTLIILFSVLILATKYYGNYCVDGYTQVLAVPMLALLILINIGILYLIDYKRKKYKTTNFIVLICISLVSINLLLGFFSEQKQISYKLKLDTEWESREEVVLFKKVHIG